MPESSKLKVFLCHSKDDKPKVRELYRRLVADGFDAWLDEEKLMPGQDWDLEISMAVRKADVVVVCLSNGSITKEGYVQKEIRLALNVADEKPDGTIFLIPARLENCNVPDRITRFQWVDLYEKSGYSRLQEALHRRGHDLNIRFNSGNVLSITGKKGSNIPFLGSISSTSFLNKTEADLSENSFIAVAHDLIANKAGNLFALQVEGILTQDAMINNGDYVIIESTNKVRNGEMAAIWLPQDNKAMLKYYYEDASQYRLVSANPKISPYLIDISKPLEIKGRVVMFIQKTRVDSPGFSYISKIRSQVTLIKQRAEEVKPDIKTYAEEAKPDIKQHVDVPELEIKPSIDSIKFDKKQDIKFPEPELVKIPAGKFLMGTTKEQAERAVREGANKIWVEREMPQHTVELSEYFIGKYPITYYQYQAFLNDTGHFQPRDWKDGQFPEGKKDHPVVYVMWNDAVAYCEWLSNKSSRLYRLPTEAEWEKAARGEDGRIYPWGNDFTSQKANTSEAKIEDTTIVGRFSPQGDSIYACADMIGNVWEWCNDWFDEHEYKTRLNKTTKNPQGLRNGSSRVLRGGGFVDFHWNARCARRHQNSPTLSSLNYIGFRVASSFI